MKSQVARDKKSGETVYRRRRKKWQILHSSSRKENLPWHRVVNSQGGISLKPRRGYEVQKALLSKECVEFDENDHIELEDYIWKPS